MTLAFLWWWNRAGEIYPFWRDGLRSALETIGINNQVDIFLGEKMPDREFDAYLLWGDSNCAAIDKLSTYKGKKGIILTTNPQNIENLKKLDVVFCESAPVYEEVRKHGIRAVRAFGTDTDFFTPDDKVKKDIEYFYPATFSPWKLQRDIAYLGDKLWCVGTVQPDGGYDLGRCEATGVHIAKGYFKVEHIRDLYRRAKKVIIPAIHGSERTVLEAMSSDILPDVTNPQNIRTRSYIEEFKQSGLKSPREFAVKNYSHIKYAKDIIKGYE